MARLVLLKPYDMLKPGAVYETDGGVASVLIRDRIARLWTAEDGSPLLPDGAAEAHPRKTEKKTKRAK